MYKRNNIKLNILILTFATLLAGCGGGSSSTSTETSIPSINAVHSGQVKDSVTGEDLGNVKVSIGSYTATTDSNGFYTLSNLTETEESVVNFEKEGYFLGSTKIRIKELSGDNIPSTNYLEYRMHAHNYQWDYESIEGISMENISIDATYLDRDTNPYNGTISAKLTIIDVTTDEGKPLFPGTFEGINTNGLQVQFYSYGLISISLKDSKGKALSFANGETGTIIFNTIPSLEEDNIIPLWYFNYEQGLWFEEGYAELQTDGTYKGEISHPGTWSLNKPIENDPGIYRGRILNEDGSPISDVRLQAVGDNWLSSDLSTDEDGVFELKVIPGKSFQLTAYNYQDKYKASYNNTIAAIASGDIVDN